MSRLRFSTARAVFDAVPAGIEPIATPASDEPPLAFLAGLARSPTPEDALTFAAYMLARREAVWWGCQSVRAMDPRAGESAALLAAENWVREPDDDTRTAALAAGQTGDRLVPATWLALAAGWSGGVMSAEHPAPCPPHLTGKSVRLAVLSALAGVEAHRRGDALRGCVDRAIRLAQAA